MSQRQAAVIGLARAGKNGPQAEVAKWLADHGLHVAEQVPCDRDDLALEQALNTLLPKKYDLVAVCGGTGLATDNPTPRVLDSLCQHQIPGLGEIMRQRGMEKSPFAWVSRGGGWVHNETLVLGLPGSPSGATESLDAIADCLDKAMRAVQRRCDSRKNLT